MLDKRVFRNLDIVFITVTLLLLGASLLILSTASITVASNDPNHYVKLQALWIGSGLLIALTVAAFDYQKFRSISWGIYALTLALLIAVFFFGTSAKGAQRWIPITSSFSIQPSEFAKMLMIIAFADFLAKREGKLNRYRDFVAPFLYFAVPMLLIFKQPDLGTTMVLAAIFLGMMLVAGANPWKMGALIVGGSAIFGVALWLHFATDLPGWLQWAQGLPLPFEDYQLQRLVIFMDPASDTSGDGYHIIQSIWAIGSGGLWGKGYRAGTQGQLNFLPEHHTDFIFSVVGEEFGFIGAVTLLFLFFIFLMRSINIGVRAKDNYGMLITAGIVSMFTFHILINVGMTSGIMPVTGIPLPFISYGGSTMWTNMSAVGILLSISLRRQKYMF